jgi:pimeloyl-ACP methyl ester carboxylesterase
MKAIFFVSSFLLSIGSAMVHNSYLSHLRENQRVNWESCGYFKCANVKVPIKHLDADKRTLNIPLTLYPALMQPASRTIIIHPDGPGKSGIEFLHLNAYSISKILFGQVDIVAFDHRGVGLNLENIDGYAMDEDPLSWRKTTDQNTLNSFDEAAKIFAQTCDAQTKGFLAHTSTATIVRDLDWIRSALQMEKLNFWGFNYGSILGVTYANMFPNSVGRIILDGAINPEYYYGTIDEY